MSRADFADRLLAWHARRGRHDLPWQQPRTPYRVWVSEIMLQQTQVATVTPYFECFMRRFPDLAALAAAPLDEVLALWSGLGYYARARNLHRAARTVVRTHGGALPADPEQLAALPGIGRSTANAICAQAFGMRLPILDANARRLLARHAGICGDATRASTRRALWDAAQARLPTSPAAMPDYTQAVMDLGAMICTSRSARCHACPVADDCAARALGDPLAFPARPRRRARPLRRWTALLACDGDRLLLTRRPPSGIWGALWCLPIAEQPPPPQAELLTELQHQFTHFTLRLAVVAADAAEAGLGDADSGWFTIPEARALGLPRPIRTLLDQLQGSRRFP